VRSIQESQNSGPRKVAKLVNPRFDEVAVEVRDEVARRQVRAQFPPLSRLLRRAFEVRMIFDDLPSLNGRPTNILRAVNRNSTGKLALSGPDSPRCPIQTSTERTSSWRQDVTKVMGFSGAAFRASAT
jgi:hypothetical protein